jgi:hypothetical protein
VVLDIAKAFFTAAGVTGITNRADGVEDVRLQKIVNVCREMQERSEKVRVVREFVNVPGAVDD